MLDGLRAETSVVELPGGEGGNWMGVSKRGGGRWRQEVGSGEKWGVDAREVVMNSKEYSVSSD